MKHRTLCLICASTVLTLSALIPASAALYSNGTPQEKWTMDSQNRVWKYQLSGGSFAKGWQHINENYYYFNIGGKMVTGWQEINHKWYYMNETGQMLSSEFVTIDSLTYYLDDDGTRNFSGPYSDFEVVLGFNASDVRKQHDSVTCTAYSDLLAGKISGQVEKTAEYKDKAGRIWGECGAQWAYVTTIQDSTSWDAGRRMREAYLRVLEGTPVILRCSGHSVVAVGVRRIDDINEITPSDILVGDSATGTVMTLEELAGKGYNIYKPDRQWNVYIPRGASDIPLTAY